jgi:hypothetical protein
MEKTKLQVTAEEISEELIRLKRENFAKVRTFNAEEMLDHIERVLDQTDLVVEGFNYSAQMTAFEGIALHTIQKIAQSLELVQYWIEFNNTEDDDPLNLKEQDDEL